MHLQFVILNLSFRRTYIIVIFFGGEGGREESLLGLHYIYRYNIHLQPVLPIINCKLREIYFYKTIYWLLKSGKFFILCRRTYLPRRTKRFFPLFTARD